MLLERDLQTFAELGRALWANPEQSDPIAIQTLSATALLQLNEERRVERAAAALLERANRQGMAQNTRANLGVSGVFGNPFFRLLPMERLALVALHSGRWSYARLGRVLGESPERVEEIAWAIRCKTGNGATAMGARSATLNCPEYDPRRPWTQRFLDEELPNSQRVFLQNHLMACDSCRNSLSRCRDLYYAVDKLIPRIQAADDSVVDNLESIFDSSRWVKSPLDRGVFESLLIFLRRPDFWVGLVFFGGLALAARWLSGR